MPEVISPVIPGPSISEPQSQVPPHFHKDYRIEEKDLIPDGDFVSVVPDWAAPEGTEVSYLSGSTFRRYKMVDGSWRQIGSDSTDSDFFSAFIDLVHWNSIDGFTVDTNGGGTATARDGYLELHTPGASGIYVFAYGKVHYNILESGKLLTVEWQIANLTSISDVELYLLMVEDVGSLPPTTENHFGFKTVNGTVKATNANDTTQTLSSAFGGISLTTGGQRVRLKAVLNPGTDCKFYADGVLKATHTTNLPTAANLRLCVGIRTTDADAKTGFINRVLIKKEY